jgi:hypothetical protein
MRARLIFAEIREGWRDLALAGMLATSAISGGAAEGPATSNFARQPLDDFFKALHLVEVGGDLYPKDGDNGRAIGPFQVWRAYWQDAVRFDPSIGGRYQDCRNYAYAKKVVAAYLRGHAPSAWANRDFVTLAKIHNGGPTGGKASASDYAARVKNVMDDMAKKSKSTQVAGN